MSGVTAYMQEFPDSSSRDWRLNYPRVGFATRREPEIHVTGPIPGWWTDLAPRVLQLMHLRPDWDPRGSTAVSRNNLQDAVTFLVRVMRPDTPAPWVGPLANGGVELAWHVGNVEVEAIFDRARGECELLVTVGENESEAPIEHAESLFAEVADRLSAGDPVAA